MNTEQTKGERQFVTALARGLAILRCFGREHDVLGTSDLAALTKLPQPTVWRLCATLETLGYLVKAPNSTKFQLGPAAMALGAAALAGRQSTDTAQALMQALADRYRSAVALGEYHDGRIVYILRCQGDSPLLLNLRVGSTIDLLASAIGRAYIASASPREQKQFLHAAAERNQETYEAVQQAIKNYRDLEYVTRYRPEHHINTVATAFEVSPTKRYVLSCGGPATLLPVDLIEEEVAMALRSVAHQLKSVLQYGKISP